MLKVCDIPDFSFVFCLLCCDLISATPLCTEEVLWSKLCGIAVAYSLGMRKNLRKVKILFSFVREDMSSSSTS
jgi:hypothetical protein